MLNSNNFGIYNIGSKNGFSKYFFAILFAKFLKIKDPKIIKIKKRNLNFYARRNNDMRLKVIKFESNFKVKLPTLYSEIKKIIQCYI